MRYGRFATVLTLRLVTTAMLVTGLFAIPAVAQTVVNGDVIGTVTDSAGAVVEGTNVTLVDTAEGKSQVATTNSTGLYRFSFLKPDV